MTTAGPSELPGLQVRPAQRPDLLAVYRIEQSAFPQPWPFSAFDQYLGEPGFLVADDGTVVGYVVSDTITSHGRRMGHVKDLAVHEHHRRRGVGETLLRRAITVLETEQIRSIKLEVRESNDRAISLYESYGFTQQGKVTEYYSDGEDALVFVRPV